VRPLVLLQDLLSLRLRAGGLNRAPSPTLALATPWLSVVLASILPTMPLIASAPVMPPFALMLLVAWSQIRPGLLPIWAGLPLGAFDDLYSGQPFGSAILLWSLTMIVLFIIEARIPWRSYLLDWLVAAGLICSCILAMLVIANAAGGAAGLIVVAPQAAAAVLLYPLMGRMAAALDRFRLIRIVDLG
jgi:rod shape-determining protein MreD